LIQTYATNSSYGLFERIQKLDRYLRDNISGPYASDAQELMSQLESQRQMSVKQRQIEARKQEEQARIQRERERRAQQQQQAAQLRNDLTRQLSSSSRYRSIATVPSATAPRD